MTAQRFLRARDDDRTRAVEDIGAAYADGQITIEEHDERCDAALRARTVGELAILVGDLQRPGDLPTPVVVARNDGLLDLLRRFDYAAPFRVLRTGLVAVLVVVVVGVLLGGWALTKAVSAAGDGFEGVDGGIFTGDSAEAYEGPGPQTIEGFEQMLDDLDAEVGSTVVSAAVIFKDYAVLTIVSPDDPRLTDYYYYGEGELQEPTNQSPLQVDDPVLDLRDVDMERATHWLDVVPGMVNVPDADETWLNIWDFGSNHLNVMVYASNTYNDTGYLVTTPAGELTDKTLFSG